MSTTTRLGPAKTRADHPRAAGLRVLRALVARGAATLADLVEDLGGHPNSTRAQLQGLVEQRFVARADGAPAGRGRPPRTYVPTTAGRQVAEEDPGLDPSAALVEALVEHLAAGPDPQAAARAVGQSWGRRLAAGDDRGLLGTLAAQGFTPVESPEGIALLTCPLLAAAEERPDVTCGIHQGMVDAISGEPRALVPFARPGACLVLPSE